MVLLKIYINHNFLVFINENFFNPLFFVPKTTNFEPEKVDKIKQYKTVSLTLNPFSLTHSLSVTKDKCKSHVDENMPVLKMYANDLKETFSESGVLVSRTVDGMVIIIYLIVCLI